MHSVPWLRCAAVAASLVVVPEARADGYEIVDLGRQMLPMQVNDAGQIAGLRGMKERAIEFRAGHWRYLPFADRIGIADAIDRRGDAAGEQSGIAVMWNRTGRRIELSVPEGAVFSEATGLSDDGVAAGYYQTTAGGPTRCFRTQPGGSAEDLGFPAHGDRCIAAAINEALQIAGTADLEPGGPSRAFLWQDGAFRSLGTLAGGDASVAHAVNGRGQVVGEATTGVAGQTHAFLFTGGQMHDLGGSGRFFNSRALAIDDARAGAPGIVGYGFGPDGLHFHAVRFEIGAGPVALEQEVADLGDWRLTYAVGINNEGVIVGQGQRSDGTHGFMLVPRTLH